MDIMNVIAEAFRFITRYLETTVVISGLTFTVGSFYLFGLLTTLVIYLLRRMGD